MHFRRLVPFIVVFAIAALAGVKFAGWIAHRQDVSSRQREKLAWIDEYEGLGERSGVSRVLALDTSAATISVRAGQPVPVPIRLSNGGRETLSLNSWLEPYPAALQSNQFPLKVRITRAGHPLDWHGNTVLRSAHTKEDFLTLAPGKIHTETVNLTGERESGGWNLSVPGEYQAVLWYETYLTGKHIGVKAWTGMTNAVTVTVIVLPAGGKGR